MLRLFEEHEEFDRFSSFDTSTGRLSTITEAEFDKYLP
jgi:hypothetical protein